MFIQEFRSNIHRIDTSVPQFARTFRGRSIVVTSNLIFEVLHVPWVALPNYLGYDRLQIMSREMSFYLIFVRHLPHGVSKTPHARALQKV